MKLLQIQSQLINKDSFFQIIFDKISLSTFTDIFKKFLKKKN